MNCCVTGLQWGDEGKGKVVDILAENCNVVVRYSGGANAGHTVIVDDNKFALHLLPSGSVRKDKTCVIANGVVLDPQIVIEEISSLEEKGISLKGRLLISYNAHVVMDYHKLEDQLRENSLGNKKIGTTIRGIGPCYADKISRTLAVRADDFLDMENLKKKLSLIVEYKNKIFSALYQTDKIDVNKIFEKCIEYSEKLGPYLADTTEFLHDALKKNKSILFEGAQGTLLDLDHGTFPYVTSSNASSLGMPAGSGVPAKNVDKFVGVVKAYTSRVGEGPFPTELDNEIGQYIREEGNEYGTTTGRPRRCGWFDAVAVAYSCALGSINEIALMHLDTLSGLEELKICKKYLIDGKETDFFPSNAAKLARAKCIFETLPGWNDDITAVRQFDQLPENAKAYVAAVEELTRRPVTMIGIGPKRTQVIYR